MPTEPATSVPPHEVMQFVHTNINHGVPMAMAVLAVVLALALGLVVGLLCARRRLRADLVLEAS